MGENFRPDFSECDYAFSYDFIEDNPRHFRLPLYALYDDVELLTLNKPSIDEITKSKKKFCCFIVSNKYCPERNHFFKKLSKYKKVDSGGRYLNNIGGPVRDKIDFLKDYKFTIAFENSSFPGYVTEKPFEAMLVHTIPIYWGSPLVSKDFNTRSFINYHDFRNDEEVIQRIIEIDSYPEEYKTLLSEPYFENNLVNEYVKNENILNQFDFIFTDSLSKTPTTLSSLSP